MDKKIHVDQLMAKYFSGNITAPEKEKLLEWMDFHEDNRMYFDEMLQLWAATEDYDNEFQADVGKAWQKVALSITQKPLLRIENNNTPVKKGGFKNNRLLLRIAASILFLVMVTLWWTNNNQTILIQTAMLENSEVQLPDGTKVWLNQNSQISYNKKFKKRDVTLTGEAFFDVFRDESSPFTISSGTTKTTVLGTSFNVRAYPEDEEIIVTVTSGSVELSADSEPDQKVILKANEAGVFTKSKKQVAKTVVENDNSTSWKTQKLSFNNTPMKDVFAAVERHFGIEIEVYNQAVWQCEFFGTYDQPKLDDMLEAMKFAMGLEFEKDGNHYTVSGGEGCEKE